MKRFTGEEFDRVVCEFSMDRSHPFRESELDDLVNRITLEANAILDQQLRELTTVYGNKSPIWGQSRTGWSDRPNTHKAKLFAVTLIDEPWPWEKK